jgi:PKD repeat protein
VYCRVDRAPRRGAIEIPKEIGGEKEMNNKTIKISSLVICLVMVATVFAAMMSSASATTPYTGSVRLVEKNPSNWSVVPEGNYGVLNYTIDSNGLMTYNFNVVDNDTLTDNHTLVVIAPELNGTGEWPQIGSIAIPDNGTDVNISTCLGWINDSKDYKGEVYGAKIWYAPTADFNFSGGYFTAWHPGNILFEEDLIVPTPEADANGPYVGDEGTPVTFNGSGSYDPNECIVSWLWDLDGDGTYETNATATRGIVNYTWEDDYSGNASLKITDSFGITDVDNTTVTVKNVAPIVEAGDNQAVNAGDNVSFSGNFTDPGNDTYIIEWDFGDGYNATGTLTPTHVYDDEGYYNVTLTVTDDDGGVGTDTLSISLIPAIPANVIIKPETLNLASKGVFTAFIQLPAGYGVADIDVSTVVCEGAPAIRGTVSDGTYIAKFNRPDLVNVTTSNEVTLTVTGELNDGTPFAGSETVRVIEKGEGKKLWHHQWRISHRLKP